MRDIIIQAVSFAFLSSFYIALGLRVLLAKNPFIGSQLWIRSHKFCAINGDFALRQCGLNIRRKAGYPHLWLLAA